MKRGVMTAGVSVCAFALLCTPTAGADPSEVPAEPVPVPAEKVSAPKALDDPTRTGDPLTDACKLFDAALSVAAANYEDFAYATAGNGNYVNYQDAEVGRTNVIGRTALRQSAAAALSASRTPGLPPEVSDPMRSWSLRATKLLLVMGLRGGGDSLNNTVTDMNTDADNAQLACVQARTPNPLP